MKKFPQRLLLTVIFCFVVSAAYGCVSSKTKESTLVNPIKTPWRIVYSDASNNQFHFHQSSENKPARILYTPVTPNESSSGTYSGGNIKETIVDTPTVQNLWEKFNILEQSTNEHIQRREMGTGRFQIESADTPLRTFTIRSGTLLTSFEGFVAPFRGSGKETNTTGKHTTVIGVASRAKVGALLITKDGNVWVDFRDWPSLAFGKRLRVEGNWSTRNDLPVFIQRKNEPIRSGMPVPPGTDLKKASTRRVLVIFSWEVLSEETHP